MTKSESASSELFIETTKSKLRRIQKHKRRLLSLSQLRKVAQNKAQNPCSVNLQETDISLHPNQFPEQPTQDSQATTLPLEQKSASKLEIERFLLEKMRKPQGNHLLHKLVSHVAENLPEERLAAIKSSHITAKMIKESLHGEAVNFGRKNSFSAEEDELILGLIAKLGKNWKEIAGTLKNKTPNMVKNRYYTYLKKKYEQKYSEMLSMRSSPSTDEPSVKLEEEASLLGALRENAAKKAGTDFASKMKTLGELCRVNQILDLEKRKTIANIMRLQHRNILKQTENKRRALLGNHLNLAFMAQNQPGLNFPVINHPSLCLPGMDLRKAFIKEQENLGSNPLNLQIRNLENVITDALKQLNNLKSAYGGL